MLTEEEETAYLQFFKRAAVYHVNNTNVSWGPIVKSYLVILPQAVNEFYTRWRFTAFIG